MARGNLKTGNKIFYPNPNWPVGSIYTTVNNENPSKWFGGTWELFAPGRCLIGVDLDDEDFNQVKKSGGSKYLQAHTHNIPSKQSPGNVVSSKNERANAGGTGSWTSYNPETSETGTGNSGNLQPYITVYFFIRIA